MRAIQIAHLASSALVRAVGIMIRHFDSQFLSAFVIKPSQALLSLVSAFIDFRISVFIRDCFEVPAIEGVVLESCPSKMGPC